MKLWIFEQEITEGAEGAEGLSHRAFAARFCWVFQHFRFLAFQLLSRKSYVFSAILCVLRGSAVNPMADAAATSQVGDLPFQGNKLIFIRTNFKGEPLGSSTLLGSPRAVTWPSFTSERTGSGQDERSADPRAS